MSELAPCPKCKRHVRIAVASCPFCAIALVGLRARNVIPRALTRAAIFSAALAGCQQKATKPNAGSAAGSAVVEPRVADDAAAPVPTAESGSGSAAATVDAGDVADAATPAEAGSASRAERIKEKLDMKKKVREQHLREQQMAKPYGAPPARRRIV